MIQRRLLLLLVVVGSLIGGIGPGGTTTVTLATTAQPLTTASTSGAWVFVQPLSTNSSTIIKLGDKTSQVTVVDTSKGDRGFFFPPVGGSPNYYDLTKIYVKVSTNGDGVSFLYGK